MKDEILGEERWVLGCGERSEKKWFDIMFIKSTEDKVGGNVLCILLFF